LQAILHGENPVDCGESGSTLRFLLPLAAVKGGEWTFTGHGRLMERPLGVYEELFPAHGDKILRDNGAIRISGRLSGGEFALPGNISSQFVSGLLMALPLLSQRAPGGGEDSIIRLTTPLESAPYVDLTLDVMAAYGVKVGSPPSALPQFVVPAGSMYALPAAPFRVEGDYSQAAYFLCAGALGCDVGVAGLSAGSRQGDAAGLDVLKSMGGAYRHRETEHARSLQARPSASGLHGALIDARDIPDLVPPLAALACFAAGETRICGAERLRLKESDRLTALATMLGGLGADIRETPDGLLIHGQEQIAGGEADSFGDHRIAMSAALASLCCRGPVCLSGSSAVNKSYPNFWKDWGVQ
jgi:3-phosphoshikimate 1-carboxyvinyltransferase